MDPSVIGEEHSVSETCVKHSFETAAGVCRQCRNSYCSECLVFAFGENKPPYCVTCALNVAGVRQQGAKPNPRLRKRGLFGRKVVVDEEPRTEKGFDDIQIVLPDQVDASPMMTRSAHRSIAPEVLRMVESTDSDADVDSSLDAESGAIAVVAPPEGPSDSLADWAASLDPTGGSSDGGYDDVRPETSSSEAWPDDSPGRKY